MEFGAVALDEAESDRHLELEGGIFGDHLKLDERIPS
jgi:hypothetical protein